MRWFRMLALAPVLLLNANAYADSTVLVGGATGRQGNAVIEQLNERGYAVRCMTRKPEGKKAQRIRERCTEIVQGDYGDPVSLDAAMSGVDKVFFYSGFSMNELQEGKNVIAAAQKAGVQHVVYTSGAASEPGKGVAGSAKTEVELALVDSGVPFTVLRPVAFMENFDRQQKRTLEKGIFDSRAPERIVVFISIPDIGFFVGEAFDDPERWLNSSANIAADLMTVEEYVDTYRRVTGANIAYTRLPLDEYLEMFPKPLRPLFRWYEETGYESSASSLQTVIDRYPNLTGLEAYLRATGWADIGADSVE